MKTPIRTSCAALLLCLLPFLSTGQTLHLFGGYNSDVYLGCLNCNEFDSNSVWNEFGTYGSNLSPNSIWNDIGNYGSDISPYSPWNDISSTPPKVLDESGNFYGYLTMNTIKPQRATFDLALALYRYHHLIKEDVSKWYQELFY